MSQVSWDDEETVRLRPPADPWAGAQDGTTQQFAAPGTRRRRVFGYVYEVITGDPQDGPHPYIGQTTDTIHHRVHGPSGHTSAQEVAENPWKARILPGRAGYRRLKTIYATGSPVEDAMRLDLAEAILIDELKTTYNIQRPIRSGRHPQEPRPQARNSRVTARRRRRPPVRLVMFLLVVAFFTYLAARLIVAMQLPWPAVPWIAAPALGTWFGWLVFWRVHRNVRKLTRRGR